MWQIAFGVRVARLALFFIGVCGLAPAAPALAVAPTLMSVGQRNRVPTATFSTPRATSVTIYVASKPDRGPVGAAPPSSSAAGSARWVIRDLGTLGGPDSEAAAINERGEIVGKAATQARDARGDAVVHGFLWRGGMLRDLGTLGGPASNARAITRRARSSATQRRGART